MPQLLIRDVPFETKQALREILGTPLMTDGVPEISREGCSLLLEHPTS